MMGDFIRRERDGGISRIVLDRPPLNVLHRPMLEELEAEIAAAAADPGSRVLVLSGAGRAFCAGVDVADHLPDRVETTLSRFHGAVSGLLSLEIPSVAAVNGAALGGGCELAIACDVAIACRGAKLGQPEVRLGAFPPAAAALLPGLVGPRRALDLILSGRTIVAEEAEAWGLVTRTAPADDFEDEVEAYAAHLAALSKPVLKLAKRATRGDAERTARALRQAERLYLEDLIGLDDATEGLAAFLEKRDPSWSHA